MRRVDEFRFDRECPLEEADGVLVAPEQVRGGAGSGQRRGVARIGGDREAERGGGLLRFAALECLQSGSQRSLRKRLGARERERGNEEHLEHEGRGDSKAGAGRAAAFTIALSGECKGRQVTVSWSRRQNRMASIGGWISANEAQPCPRHCS